MTTEKETERKAQLHKDAMKRYETLRGHWSPIYRQMEEDTLFKIGEGHWDDYPYLKPDDIQLVINKCESEVDAIVNEMRSQKPAINTSPVDDKGDVDTSEVFDSLIRCIEKESDASSANDTAAQHQVTSGLGWLRVELDWIEGTFDQKIKISTTHDFTSIMIDDLSTKLDGSDMNDAFVIADNITKEQFKKEYPDFADTSFDGYAAGWAETETVRIAEYFYKEASYETLHLVETDGVQTVMRDKDVKDYNNALKDTLGKLNIIRTRKEKIDLIKWCKLSGANVLDERDWIGKYIPIIPVYGKMTFVQGRRVISGLISVLRDPQKMINYWEVYNLKTAAMQPNAPYIGYDEVVDGYADIYKNANNKNYPFLPAKKAYDKHGNLLPLPQRQMPPQISPYMQQQTQLSMQHIKAVTGKVYDEGSKTLGSESGKAILAKERKSDVASFHYVDNQSKSIAQCGRILVDLIPKVYSGARIQRIIGIDDEEELVPINQPFVEENGIKRPYDPEKDQDYSGIYDLEAGTYDVSVSVGPSFSSQRQEFVESVINVASVIPDIMRVGSDIILRNMDFPGAQELADRMKKTLPPELSDDEQTPEQVALKQAGQALEVLQAKIGEMEKQLDDKKRSEDMKHQVDVFKAETDRFEAQIKYFEARTDADERIQPQDWMQMASFMGALKEQMDDLTTGFSMLLDADTEETPQEPPQGGFFNGEPSQPIQ